MPNCNIHVNPPAPFKRANGAYGGLDKLNLIWVGFFNVSVTSYIRYELDQSSLAPIGRILRFVSSQTVINLSKHSSLLVLIGGLPLLLICLNTIYLSANGPGCDIQRDSI